MSGKNEIKEVWNSDRDLMCGVLADGRLFTSDSAGGLVLPPSEANRKFILERFEMRKRERKGGEL